MDITQDQVNPGYAVRLEIIEAMKVYARSHDWLEPNCLHLTPRQEKLLEQHYRDEGMVKAGESIRDLPSVLGCIVEWDAKKFVVRRLQPS